MYRSVSKELSSSGLVSRCSKYSQKLRKLNALVTEMYGTGESQAIVSQLRQLKGKPSRKLEGLPLIVKDNFCTKGIKTSCASRMLDNFVPPYTSTVVSRCVDEGAVLVAKSNMDEFALGSASVDGCYAPVRNPWPHLSSPRVPLHHDSGVESESAEQEIDNDLDWHVAGGSSGGSAVAVATSMCVASIGSDTGGSVRNPASYCGVVGLKPTYGRLSRHGLVALMNGIDVPGVFAADVDTAALFYSVMSGADKFDSTCVNKPPQQITLAEDTDLTGLRVGVPKEFFTENLTQDVALAWDNSIEHLCKLGAKIVPVSLPNNNSSTLVYSVLAAADIASNMSRYDGLEFGLRCDDDHNSSEEMLTSTRAEAFSDVVRDRILVGNYFLIKQNYHEYYERAQKVQRLIQNDFKKVFADQVDLLITPTMHSSAPRASFYQQEDNLTRIHEYDTYTQGVNLAGVPAISVPVAYCSQGLPIGMQLIGDLFNEHLVLHVAKCLETVSEFRLPDLAYLLDQ